VRIHFLPHHFSQGFVAEIDKVVKAVPALPGPGFQSVQRSPSTFSAHHPADTARRTEILHIGQRGVAGVVHHHVEQDTDTALVGFIDQRRKSASLPMLASRRVQSCV
jgi:hypothetical protein